MTPCTPWTGRHRKDDGRPMKGKLYAYRWLWEREFGPLPEGAILHHRCDNKWCVNPSHLKPTTQGQHIRDHGLPGDNCQAVKTHCPAGHEYTPENTYVYSRAGRGVRDGGPERHCRTCRQDAKRRYRLRLREAV